MPSRPPGRGGAPEAILGHWVLALVVFFAGLFGACGQAAAALTVSQSAGFNFTHTGSVSTGLAAINVTFSNPSTTSPTALTFPRFDPTLGTLTGVTVTVTTTSTPFTVQSSGVLSLASNVSATRSLAFTVTSGTATATGSNAVTTSGSTFLTLLGIGSVQIGGAPLASSKTFFTPSDLAQFTGSGNASVALTAVDTLSVSVGISLLNGAGFSGTGQYVGSATVVYTYDPGIPVTGRVFQDDGAGSGVANDGVQNGAEAGLAGRLLALLDASGASLGSATSQADGSYRLTVPTTVATGAVLRVQQTNAAGTLSTGASIGSSSGAYDRSSDAISWAFTRGVGVSGLNFGDVPRTRLAVAQNKTGLPGTVLFFTHTLVAPSTGQLTLSVTHAATPAVPGWTEFVAIDANGNGKLDANEPPLTGSLSVAAGQTLSLVVKVDLPANAPYDAAVQVTVQTSMSYANASPALSDTLSLIDSVRVTDDTAASLTLQKSVDTASATPGSTMVYTITFSNTGSAPITNMEIDDMTPAYTTFVSVGAGSLPSSLGMPAVTKPASGAAGGLRWSFPGPLAPGGSGTVTFTVVVDP